MKIKLTVLTIFFMLALVTVVHADGMPYWVIGHEGALRAPGARYYGMSSSMYVMSSPDIDSDKVSSIYLDFDDNDYFETGHDYTYNASNDTYVLTRFIAYEREGYTNYQVLHQYAGGITPGTNLYTEINNLSMDGGISDLWRAKTGVTTWDRDMNFYKANVECAAERYTTATTNYARFNNMKWKDYDGTWVSWSNGQWHRATGETYYSGVFNSDDTQFESKQL